MTTATPTSLTLTQKKRLWRQYKHDTFDQISRDKSLMFNWFLQNNDILGFISDQDYIKSRYVAQRVYISGAVSFFGTASFVFICDQILMRIAFPKFRINRFRILVNLFKYMLLPCIGYTINKQFYLEPQMNFFFNMQDKYGFGFQDYMKANRVFQRALQVDRLQELRQKRQEFNWQGIPQLKQQQQKK